ncbi:MAG: DUF2520 domain-containing protein [Gemmatimonadetes bacterium]|nr:DUF2520 domain-containing protein [Gemmatimonadota bacterium]MDA1104223.1 DUF2520 domain-containing protein [Gemmatimonadota bacterium]
MAGQVTIVGPGRMGLALGVSLLRAQAVGGVTFFGRRPEPPSHPIFADARVWYVYGAEALGGHTVALFLAVPDEMVPELAVVIAAQGAAPPGCAAFHLSGYLSTDVMAPLHREGYAVGSFHPLQIISATVAAAERIPGSYITVTGSPAAVSVARMLAREIDCHVLTVPDGRRPLYHAATVLATAYLAPLLDLSARLMERAGVPSEDVLPALLPLIRGTVTGLQEEGVAGALVGPIARGDIETVGLHLRALDPEAQRLYAVFGAEVLRLMGPEIDDRTRAALGELLERHSGMATTGTGI